MAAVLPWLADVGQRGDPADPGQLHWTDDGGAVRVRDGMRTPLPTAEPSGQEVVLTVHVRAPAEPGRHHLILDLVHEQTTWFSEQGCAIPPVVVDVK